MRQLFESARSLGPYLLVGLLLPGGSVVAVLLWLLRLYRKRGGSHAQVPVRARLGHGGRNRGIDGLIGLLSSRNRS